MTAIKLRQQVKDGGIFIPLEGLDNQVIEIEVRINPTNESTGENNTAQIARDFFSKINEKSTINFDELNVYEQ